MEPKYRDTAWYNSSGKTWWYHATKTLIWGNTLPTNSFSGNPKALSARALEKIRDLVEEVYAPRG